MTKDELIEQLRALARDGDDHERDHVRADNLLLDYINDPEVSAAFEAIEKWYA